MNKIYGKIYISDLSILSFTAIKVFIYLSSFGSKKCYPSELTIAKAIGLSTNCSVNPDVSRAIQELVEHKLISVKYAKKSSNTYKIIRKVNQDKEQAYGLVDLSLLPKSKPTEIKLIAYLSSVSKFFSMEFEPKKVAKILDLSVKSISRAINSLLADNIIRASNYEGKKKYVLSFRFNPFIELNDIKQSYSHSKNNNTRQLQAVAM